MKKIYIVFLIVLIGCSSVKTIDNNQLNTIEISYDQDDEHINFNIKNLNNSVIYYVKKNKLEIDKLIDDEWIRVKILPCPCDAPCREMNNDVPIQANKNLVVNWNMIESWCGKREKNEFVREMITKRVEKGEYRITVKLKDTNGILQQKSKKFTIN